jgi:hypothetical protein
MATSSQLLLEIVEHDMQPSLRGLPEPSPYPPAKTDKPVNEQLRSTLAAGRAFGKKNFTRPALAIWF